MKYAVELAKPIEVDTITLNAVYKHNALVKERNRWQKKVDWLNEQLELLKDNGCYTECIVNSEVFVVNRKYDKEKKRAEKAEAKLRTTAKEIERIADELLSDLDKSWDCPADNLVRELRTTAKRLGAKE